MAFPATNSDIMGKNTDEQLENPNLSRLNSIKAVRRQSFAKPTENANEIQALKFRHTTKAQERTRKRQQPIRLEPLPVLKIYQDRKQPEYIYQQNRFQFISSRTLKTPAVSEESQPSTESFSQSLVSQDDVKLKQIRQPSVETFSPSPPKLLRTSIGRRGLYKTSSSVFPKYTFHDREEVVKANIRDPLQIIKIIRENENLGFLYMISAVPKSSIEYDTYNLKLKCIDDLKEELGDIL